MSRSDYYERQRRAPPDRALADAFLIEWITAIRRLHRKVCGSPCIHAELRGNGIRVSASAWSG